MKAKVTASFAFRRSAITLPKSRAPFRLRGGICSGSARSAKLVEGIRACFRTLASGKLGKNRIQFGGLTTKLKGHQTLELNPSNMDTISQVFTCQMSFFWDLSHQPSKGLKPCVFSEDVEEPVADVALTWV